MKATIRRIIFFISIVISPWPLVAQSDSCHLRISLLTCAPGEELYATFGHSALRVYDTVSNEDVIYNYGTFNFGEPGFYTKFIRGKLLYYLSTSDFNSFTESYVMEKREITEQVLNLDCSEKRKILQVISENLLEKNRFYKYDFLFDNCTTRLRDLVEKSATENIHYGKAVPVNTTFRNLIYEYLDYNHEDWSKLGIDLLLGSKTDRVMSERETMFLPDYLLKTFDSTHKGIHPLVTAKTGIYQPGTLSAPGNSISPLMVFSILFILVAALSFSKNRITTQILAGFDGFVFFITGMLGFLMLFMWFGTDHIMCSNNYNLAWALPTHIIASFYMYSRKKMIKYYFRLTAMINLLLIILWFILPQAFNISLIPFVIMLITRSLVHAGIVISHGQVYHQEL